LKFEATDSLDLSPLIEQSPRDGINSLIEHAENRDYGCANPLGLITSYLGIRIRNLATITPANKSYGRELPNYTFRNYNYVSNVAGDNVIQKVCEFYSSDLQLTQSQGAFEETER